MASSIDKGEDEEEDILIWVDIDPKSNQRSTNGIYYYLFYNYTFSKL